MYKKNTRLIAKLNSMSFIFPTVLFK